MKAVPSELAEPLAIPASKGLGKWKNEFIRVGHDALAAALGCGARGCDTVRGAGRVVSGETGLGPGVPVSGSRGLKRLVEETAIWKVVLYDIIYDIT